MARGHQKIQSQAKAQEKAAKMKKQAGHSATEQKKAAQKALVISCAVCKVSTISTTLKETIVFSLSFVQFKSIGRVRINNLFVSLQSQMPDPKTYKQHFENKHPKAELPADLKDVVA